MKTGSLLLIVGAVLLIHAGFSAVHYKQIITVVSTFNGLPIDIYIEVFLGVAICLLGSLDTPQKFQLLEAHNDYKNSWDASLSESPAFRIYNHRNRFLQRRIQK